VVFGLGLFFLGTRTAVVFGVCLPVFLVLGFARPSEADCFACVGDAELSSATAPITLVRQASAASAAMTPRLRMSFVGAVGVVGVVSVVGVVGVGFDAGCSEVAAFVFIGVSLVCEAGSVPC
jgi:hypothetical protein